MCASTDIFLQDAKSYNYTLTDRVIFCNNLPQVFVYLCLDPQTDLRFLYVVNYTGCVLLALTHTLCFTLRMLVIN